MHVLSLRNGLRDKFETRTNELALEMEEEERAGDGGRTDGRIVNCFTKGNPANSIELAARVPSSSTLPIVSYGQV